MGEPSAIWSTSLIVFDKQISLTQNVIFSHGRVALLALVRHIDRLYELLGTFPNVTNAYIHPEIATTLSDVYFQQGTASTILFNDSPQAAKENAAAYKLRVGRVSYVKHLTANCPTAVLANRKVRNALVHVDEYLAKELRKENTGWAIDSAWPDRDAFVAPPGISVAYCRCYIGSEDKILHLGHEISISALRMEASAVLGAVFGVPPTSPPSYPASSV
jgi:hypothetical protein